MFLNKYIIKTAGYLQFCNEKKRKKEEDKLESMAINNNYPMDMVKS